MARVMTVGTLQQLLANENPMAAVGSCLTNMNGWVNSFKGIKHADDGTVVLDLVEETTTEEEISIK